MQTKARFDFHFLASPTPTPTHLLFTEGFRILPFELQFGKKSENSCESFKMAGENDSRLKAR